MAHPDAVPTDDSATADHPERADHAASTDGSCAGGPAHDPAGSAYGATANGSAGPAAGPAGSADGPTDNGSAGPADGPTASRPADGSAAAVDPAGSTGAPTGDANPVDGRAGGTDRVDGSAGTADPAGPAEPVHRPAGDADPAGGPARAAAAADGGRTTGRGVAVVTGATSGIGAAFARALAAQGYDLVLVARDAARLAGVAAELAGRYGIGAEALPADLATTQGCALVEARLATGVDLLVNNAGRSLHMSFVKASTAQEEELLALNVHAVMKLTHAALGPMLRAGRGAIVNVSSASAFATMMPGSTYPASKAWVNAFTESVALSVRPFGVRVLALCPGYTRTEFHDRQGIDTSKMPGFLWLDADDVVRVALRDLRKGRMLSVPDWRYKAAVFAMRHAPRALLHRAARDARGRVGHESLPDRPGR